MVTKTPRLDLDDYAVGDSPPWDHSDTVLALDEHAVVKDTFTNRPASGTYDREWFFATDRGLLYEWDDSGGTWTIVGGTGSSGNPLPEVFAAGINCENNLVDNAAGVVHKQRGAPTTSELDTGERMVYTSDGSDAHSAGDLVSARNDAGSIVSQVIAAAADDA